MNSITPITSLSNTLLQLKDEVSQEVREVINSTSESLIDFVESYRSVTRIPEPRFRSFDLRQLLERMVTLVRHDGAGLNCTIQIEVTPDDLLLYADETLIGQVILNLLKNATHAVAACETGIIRIAASSSDTGEITIDIMDNGTGISPEIAANIFVPFFTTKQNGSGIGLSISRQIMRLHNGNIALKTAQPGSTIFRLHFS